MTGAFIRVLREGMMIQNKRMKDMKNYKLLKKSIEKWQNILDGTELDKGGDNCPLCQELFSLTFQDFLQCRFRDFLQCRGCPVRKSTGKPGCRKTPYMDWVKHQRDHHYPSYEEMHKGGIKIECFGCRILALRELNFLRELAKRGEGAPGGREGKLRIDSGS